MRCTYVIHEDANFIELNAGYERKCHKVNSSECRVGEEIIELVDMNIPRPYIHTKRYKCTNVYYGNWETEAAAPITLPSDSSKADGVLYVRVLFYKRLRGVQI